MKRIKDLFVILALVGIVTSFLMILAQVVSAEVLLFETHRDVGGRTQVPMRGYIAYNPRDGEPTLAFLSFRDGDYQGMARYVKPGAKRDDGSLWRDPHGWTNWWHQDELSYWDPATLTFHIRAKGNLLIPNNDQEAMCYLSDGHELCGRYSNGGFTDRGLIPLADVNLDLQLDAKDFVEGEDNEYASWSITYPDVDPEPFASQHRWITEAETLDYVGKVYFPMDYPSGDMSGYQSSDEEWAAAVIAIPEPAAFVSMIVGMILLLSRYRSSRSC